MKTRLNCILLIDDDRPTNFFNKIIIKKSGCAENVIAVQSGLDGLDYLKGMNDNGHLHPDLIFLDINMPAMNGWEFLDEYKKLPEELKSKITVVMLTTSLNPDDYNRAEKFKEVSLYENKPLDVEKMKRIVDYCFKENQPV